MKKLALLMAFLLLLTSCAAQNSEKKQGAEIEKEQKQEDESSAEPVFSDIKYEDVRNKDQFSGFSENQIKDLNENGFLVLNPKSNGYVPTKYHEAYEMGNYSNKPLFISSDAVLNAFSIFYNGSMVEFELSEFYLSSAEMSIRLSGKLLDLYNKTEDAELKALLKKALAYTFTASRLFFNEVEHLDLNSLYNVELAGKYNSELSKFEALKSQMPTEIVFLSDEEYYKITEAKGIERSNLFGYDIDYSQFKPRGHYTMGPSLRNYFLGQMWLSNPGFELEGSNEEGKQISLIIASAFYEDRYLKNLWKRIYEITSYYSSSSDDINFTDFEPIVKNVLHFDEMRYAGITDKKVLKELDLEIAKLPAPKIVTQTHEGSKYQLSAKKQFRFMGQRYNVDQLVFTNLSKPVDKPEVSSFEFFHVMGNETAGKIADELLKPEERWGAYSEKLEEMKRFCKENPSEFFKDDLYHKYLKAIEIVLNHKVDKSNLNVPNFMKSDKYEYLKLNTALGAYAQLKHANVLYSKQMMAEMGAPEEYVSPHYLEPNVELYEQISKMTDDAILKLQKFGVDFSDLPENYDVNNLKTFSETLKSFVRISKKELAGEKLSDEELLLLGEFGGLCDMMYNYYNDINHQYGFELQESIYGRALVSDIATVEDRYLELGIGLPMNIYVLVQQNGEKVLAEGVVFSSYEFYSLKRFNHDEWMNKIAKLNEYGTVEKRNEDFSLSKIMPYANEFVNDEENKVKQEYNPEFHW